MTREKLLNQIAAYLPYNEQEAADRELILHWIQDHDDAFTRQNQVAHITASAWVVNRDRRKVLLVYHNIYNSWSWLGGHADGETDLLAVALREVKEEAGIANVRPVSPDNALNAEIAVELLQGIGLKVDWAEDGQKAVEMFEKLAPGSYFAVFMDMQMPVMDGVEATRRIRASDRPDHDVPIFAMTANTFAADRKKCYDAGMSGYIPKPIDLETITHVLEEETGE